MREYVNIRASEILGQDELISFLKSNFPDSTRTIGRAIIEGTECVETRIPSNSVEFEKLRNFIAPRRRRAIRAYRAFLLGWHLRKYSRDELLRAEALCMAISPYFEPCGEECGTLYKTTCRHCNAAEQLSDLILDLRKAPKNKDFAVTISQHEWIVSSRAVRFFERAHLNGAMFRPVFEFSHPTRQSKEWYQLQITGKAGSLAKATKLGMDPFSPGRLDWRCPAGHSLVTQFLSEVHLCKTEWDGSDFAVSKSLFGQGQNLVRPTPLIIISQRAYRIIQSAALRGFSCEVVHLI